jgi:N-terminal acetyltransferase 2
MALTALDFPFCFIAVRALGTERIGHYEHVVIDTFKNLFGLAKSEEGEALPADGGAVQAKEAWQEDIDEAEANNQGAGACKDPLRIERSTG